MIKYLLLCLSLLLIPILNMAQDIYPNYTNNDEDTVYATDALNRLYIVGLQYLNNGDLTQSEISFRSILAFPYRSKDWRTTRYYKGKAHFYLGEIYSIQKKYHKAATNYQQVVKNYAEVEEYSSSLYKLGRSFIMGGQNKEGIEILRDYNFNYGIQEGLSDNALYWIARAYMNLENYTSALLILNQILRDYPKSPMAYDIRILIAKLEIEHVNIPIIPAQVTVTNMISQSQKKANKIKKQQELINRMDQLLVIKEQLLLIKEKKMTLLNQISKARSKALQNKRLYINQDSGNYWE